MQCQRFFGIAVLPISDQSFLLALGQGKVKGHWPCPCGSGKNLRNCHDDRVRQLRQVPVCTRAFD
ncbi:SEC-C metal-binding domain-containing protein [Mesorhizobium helmanticense]